MDHIIWRSVCFLLTKCIYIYYAILLIIHLSHSSIMVWRLDRTPSIVSIMVSAFDLNETFNANRLYFNCLIESFKVRPSSLSFWVGFDLIWNFLNFNSFNILLMPFVIVLSTFFKIKIFWDMAFSYNTVSWYNSLSLFINMSMITIHVGPRVSVNFVPG